VIYRSIKQEPRALTIPEIKTVINNYVSATLRAKKAGFKPVSKLNISRSHAVLFEKI